MTAPFWPFGENMKQLTFMPRGEFERRSDPNYNGTYDDIDKMYNVEVAEHGVLRFEINDNYHDHSAQCALVFNGEVSYRLQWNKDLPTREKAYEWCESIIAEASAAGKQLLDISAKFDEGLHLLPAWYDGWNWSIVSVQKRNGIATIWYIGNECDELITDVEWQQMVRLPEITAPDGQIINPR